MSRNTTVIRPLFESSNFFITQSELEEKIRNTKQISFIPKNGFAFITLKLKAVTHIDWSNIQISRIETIKNGEINTILKQFYCTIKFVQSRNNETKVDLKVFGF